MIQGVHVLYEYSAFGILKGFMTMMLGIVSLIAILYAIDPIFDKCARKISRFIAIVVFIAFCIFSWHVTLSLPNEHYVKATISEEVSSKELFAHYEVVSTEGEIYKLKVLESDEE